MRIYPFNFVYICLLALGALLLLLMHRTLRGKPESVRKKYLLWLCAANIVLYFVYKGFLSVDAEFVQVSGIERFNWFNELPLQLCNINLFLIPLGAATGKRGIMGFAFFIAPLAALLALMFPEAAFVGYLITQPRILGFYLTHLLIVVCGISLYTLGFYKPEFADFPGIIAAFVVLSLGAHIINTVLRRTVCPQASYFFTYGADISVLNLLWRLIPIPYIYLLPALLVLLAYMSLVTLFFRKSGTLAEELPAASKI